MTQRFSHVAMTVPRSLLEDDAKARWVEFYDVVFGWTENPDFAIAGERALLRAPSDAQYVNVRASDTPMRTSGYEHLGLWVGSKAEVHRLHDVARAFAEHDAKVELGEVQTLYGGNLTTFRVRYVLPLTLEVQFAAGMLQST